MSQAANPPRSNLLALLLIIAVGAVLVVRLPIAIRDRIADTHLLDPVTDIAHLVDRHFYREFQTASLREGAIRGMLEALNDPYTEYIPPSRQSEFDRVVRGEFVGIGAQIRMNADGWLEIISPLDDSPALLAGIEAGDLIIAADGQSTWQRDIDRVIDVLIGQPGTQVRVTVERRTDASAPPQSMLPPSVPAELVITGREPGEPGGAGRPTLTAPGPAEDSVRFDLIITRQRIQAQTILGLHRDGQQWLWFADPDERIAYVRISQFTAGTIQTFPLVLTNLLQSGMRGLVLDLRQNSGGSLEAAITVSNLFLSSGEIISTQGRRRPRQSVFATAPGTLPDFPMIVLVDRVSASASEIVAGALSDNGRALVVGERTFGKGLVQTILPLPSGQGQLKITEADYYLPSGRSLQRHPDSDVWGVDPSEGFAVSLTDEQRGTLWNIRRREEVLRTNPDRADEHWNDPQWIRERLQDPQLARAVEALQTVLRTGKWPEPKPEPLNGNDES